MPVLRYIRQLLDVFIKWWWAALTGVASVLSFLAVPESGVNIRKGTVAVLVLVGMTAVFLLLSMAVKSFAWYVAEGERPRVVRFVPVPADGTRPCAFIIREGGRRLSTGYALSLFREMQGEEVPIAALSVTRGQRDREVQCHPIWIAPVHLSALSAHELDATTLLVKYEIPDHIFERLKGP